MSSKDLEEGPLSDTSSQEEKRGMFCIEMSHLAFSLDDH